MKTTSRALRATGAILCAAIALTVAVGLTAATATAQEKAKGPERVPAPAILKQSTRLGNVVRAGYTRPGSPADPLNKDGSVRPLAWTDYEGKLIGGTVYFMVLERLDNVTDERDPWGTGIENFLGAFREGRNRRDQFSPALDAKARFLYLYQVVNDRGLDPAPIRPAADKEIGSSDIASVVVHLQVDPRYITSWGHFRQTGLVATVPDADLAGDVREVVAGKDANIRLAVSSNPSILSKLPQKRYGGDAPRNRAPAHALTDLRDSLGVASSSLNLKDSLAHGKLKTEEKTRGVAFAAWGKNMVQSAQVAKEPAFVQIVYRGLDDNLVPAVNTDDDLTQIVFRADFPKDQVKLGFHSTVFGFTSDLPPVEMPLRIEDPEDATRGDGVLPAVADGTSTGTGIALAVSPAAPLASTPVASVGLQGLLGGQPGGGGGFPALGGAGAIGAAPPPTAIGGGLGADNGNGENQAQSQASDQVDTINFNALLINQQAQFQAQAQAQKQSQSQHGSACCPPGEVIPEPGAIILGLLGLPGLYFLNRRRRAVADITSV